MVAAKAAAPAARSGFPNAGAGGKVVGAVFTFVFWRLPPLVAPPFNPPLDPPAKPKLPPEAKLAGAGVGKKALPVVLPPEAKSARAGALNGLVFEGKPVDATGGGADVEPFPVVLALGAGAGIGFAFGAEKKAVGAA